MLKEVLVIFLFFIFLINYAFAYQNVSVCQTINSYFMNGEKKARVNQNLNYGALGNCLSINVSDIIADCQGHNVTGTGTGAGVGQYGFASRSNLIIRNCHFNNFTYGTMFTGLTSSNFINCSFQNNDVGLYLSLIFNNTFSGNTIINSTDYAIELRQSSHTNVFDNTNITMNSKGIYIDSSATSNNVTNSYIYGNTQYNIKLDAIGNIFSSNYLGNSSKIISTDWPTYYDNLFTGNTYSIYYGCFDDPDNLICEYAESSPSSESRSLFPLQNITSIFLTIITLFGYFVFS